MGGERPYQELSELLYPGTGWAITGARRKGLNSPLLAFGPRTGLRGKLNRFRIGCLIHRYRYLVSFVFMGLAGYASDVELALTLSGQTEWV